MERIEPATSARTPVRRQRRENIRARWLGARARNALRHPMRIFTIAAPVFVGSLVLLVLVPREGRRPRPAPPPGPPLVVMDTEPYLLAEQRARTGLGLADSLLAARRAQNARRLAAVVAVATAAPVTDSAPPAVAAHRDSLSAQIVDLDRLLGRVENAPLAASYRALGDAPAMRDDPRVKVLLDSLAEIEREREDAGTVGGVDPIFVALTSRANAVGRAIQGIAEEKRTALRSAVGALPVAAAPVPVIPVADTLRAIARRDSLQAVLNAAVEALASVRRNNVQAERQTATAREQANVTVPPVAVLTAALVLATALGFAVSFAQEVRRPHIGDPREVERATWARVLAVVRPRGVPTERSRREADKLLSPLLDPTADPYRLITAHLNAVDATTPVVTLTGDNAAVTATVATNIAAVAANDLRSTLLVDTDVGSHAVAGTLRTAAGPGVADVLRGAADWTEVIQHAVVGRDRVLDFVPCGVARSVPLTDDEARSVAAAVARLARRYDVTLVVATPERAGLVRPTPDVVVCAGLNRTPMAELLQTVTHLRETGARLSGIVLWDADDPQLPTAAELATQSAAARPTAERLAYSA